MEIYLMTISKLSSEVIDCEMIKIEHVDYPVLSDLTNSIYDKYKGLWQSGRYKLFWEYAEGDYKEIKDYMSYLTAIRLMTKRRIYVLIDDFEDIWDDNISFLENLDIMEELERIERERDIYDVKIARKEEEKLTEDTISSIESHERQPRTDAEIINYALRKVAVSWCCTTDLVQTLNLIEDLQKGYPKTRAVLHPIPDVVFEKRVFKEPKGSKGSKQSKDTPKKEKKGGKKK